MDQSGELEVLAGVPVLYFPSPQAWATWLDAHHTQPQGVWLKIAKKDAGINSVSYAEALEEALCYGWIDGQKKSYDERFFLQKFTPRRSRSGWSRVNTEKVLQLIATGRMKPAGQREIDAARADGRWDAAYSPQSDQTLPADFQAALDLHPAAKEFFQSLNKANRYAFCYRIETARKPETRQARIATFIAMLTAHEKLH